MAKYVSSHRRKQAARQWLGKEISNHAERGAEYDSDDSSLHKVQYPEKSKIDVASLLCTRATALYEFDGSLIILIHGDRKWWEALRDEKTP